MPAGFVHSQSARSRSIRGTFTLLLVWAAAAGCASTGGAPAVPTAQELPALEDQLGRNPSDVPTMVQLGAGYREAGRLDDARVLLERARETEPENGAATLFLGLTYEDLNRYADAGSVYEAYLELPGAALQDQVAARVPIVRRNELQQVLAATLVNEEDRDVAEVDPAAVAVFPFLYRGLNPEYRPLSRALSAMLITDLSQTDRLRVLERLEVQVLMDELALEETGVVDPGTAVRSGLLLGAGNVIQGAIGGSQEVVSLEASVVGVGGDVPDAPPVTDEDAAERLFDMQKRVALGLYAALGIELTVAEREAVERRWTTNLVALLEFGQGLEAEDARDYARAAGHFRRAAELDPNFQEAGERASAADLLADAASTTTTALASEAATVLLVDMGFTQFFDLAEALEGAQQLVPSAESRDPVSEVAGIEGFRPRTRIDVTIRRPPGGG